MLNLKRCKSSCISPTIQGFGCAKNSSSRSTAFYRPIEDHTNRHLEVCHCSSNRRVALEVSHLSYRPVSAAAPVLNDVSLTLEENKIGLVIGPSGSGKSTLLHVIAGFSTSYTGSIKIRPNKGGVSTSLKQSTNKVRQDIGIVFQFPERYFVGKNVFEELSYGWRHSNGSDAHSDFAERLPQVIKVAGLSSVPLDKALKELSGGYQRRVAIAVQLLQNPSVLLLDEPTAGMDLPSCKALCDTLRNVKIASAVLVVSHDTEFLSRIADDTWTMKNGGQIIQNL